MLREKALPLGLVVKERCDAPLSFLLWCVASVSTLVYIPLLLLAQLDLQSPHPEIWKS